SEGYDELKLPGSTFHILLPTRTAPTDPTMLKFFGPFQQPPESGVKISDKENPSPNNPAT
ncbi:MAG TPA: hypothetical protein VJL10_06105, partial [Anaerolineales bacterium]|nr:hypothetical protein [Anaerolineales bacterium]